MRIANERDLPAIVSIYNATIPTRQATADTVEVTVESRLKWFRQHTPDKLPLMVYEHDNRVVAWVSFQAFYGRAWSLFGTTALATEMQPCAEVTMTPYVPAGTAGRSCVVIPFDQE